VDFDEEKKVFLSTPSGVLVGLLAVLRDTDGRRCCYEAESEGLLAVAGSSRQQYNREIVALSLHVNAKKICEGILPI